MAIPLQPPFELLPAYRPITFQAFITTEDIIGPAENVHVTIFKGGVAANAKPILYKTFENVPNAAPGFTDYIFDIDIQKYCQDLLAPDASLPSIFPSKTTIFAQNNDFFDDFYIFLTYDYVSIATGLLTPILGNEVSNTYTIFTASRQNQESMFLQDYLGTGASPLANDRLFLTKSPRVLDICEDDNGFLTVIQANNAFPTNGFTASFFDAAGGLISIGLAQLPAPIASAGQTTLNVGIDALTVVSWLGVAPVLPDPLIASYEIRFGFITVIPGPTYIFLDQTEIFTYNVVPSCCGIRDLRLHWMNLLGGADSYTFNSEKDLQLTTTNDIGQKALDWVTGGLTPNNVSDIGKMKLKSEGSKAYQLNSRFLTNSEALWLSEMLTSPKVYAEIDGDFIPVIVEPTTQSISRHNGKIRIAITVTFARDLIIQRV